jgi:hypothetical protein
VQRHRPHLHFDKKNRINLLRRQQTGQNLGLFCYEDIFLFFYMGMLFAHNG